MAVLTKRKSLYYSQVGRGAEGYLKKIIARFGHDDFDFLISVYDDTSLSGEEFSKCRIVHARDMLFTRAKRMLTPEVCGGYEYIFFWMDDLDILDFDPSNFLKIIRRHGIEVAQPSLSADSVVSHGITLKKAEKTGRYTDFVETLAPVYTKEAWIKLWNFVSYTKYGRGWGYDLLAYSYCRFFKMAIIDCETVKHTRRGDRSDETRACLEQMKADYGKFLCARKQEICAISDNFYDRLLITPLRLLLYRLFFDLLTAIKRLKLLLRL